MEKEQSEPANEDAETVCMFSPLPSLPFADWLWRFWLDHHVSLQEQQEGSEHEEGEEDEEEDEEEEMDAEESSDDSDSELDEKGILLSEIHLLQRHHSVPIQTTLFCSHVVFST